MPFQSKLESREKYFKIKPIALLLTTGMIKHLRQKKVEFKAIKSFVFALGLAILQGGIAARTPTRMQGSEVKERREVTTSLPNCIAYHHTCKESKPSKNFQFFFRMEVF